METKEINKDLEVNEKDFEADLDKIESKDLD